MAEVTKDLRGFLIPTKLLKEGNLATFVALDPSADPTRIGPLAQPRGYNPEGPGPIRALTGTTYPLKEGDGSIISVSGPFLEFSAPRQKGHGYVSHPGTDPFVGVDFVAGVELTCVRGGDGGPGSEPGFSCAIACSDIQAQETETAPDRSERTKYGGWTEGGIRSISAIVGVPTSTAAGVGACAITETRFAVAYRNVDDEELVVIFCETSQENIVQVSHTIETGELVEGGDLISICLGRDGSIYGVVVKMTAITPVKSFRVVDPNDNTKAAFSLIQEEILIGDFSTTDTNRMAVLYHHRDLTFSLFLRSSDGVDGVSTIYRSKDYLSSLEASGLDFGVLGVAAIPRRDTLLIAQEVAGDDTLWEFSSAWDSGTTATNASLDVSSTFDIGWEDHTGRVHLVNGEHVQSYFYDISDVTVTGWATGSPTTIVGGPHPTVWCGASAMTVVADEGGISVVRWGGWDQVEAKAYNPWGGAADTVNQYGVAWVGWTIPSLGGWSYSTTGAPTVVSEGTILNITMGLGQEAEWLYAFDDNSESISRAWLRVCCTFQADAYVYVFVDHDATGKRYRFYFWLDNNDELNYEIDGDTTVSGVIAGAMSGEVVVDVDMDFSASVKVVRTGIESLSGRCTTASATEAVAAEAFSGTTALTIGVAADTTPATISVAFVGLSMDKGATDALFRTSDFRRGVPFVASHPVALPTYGGTLDDSVSIIWDGHKTDAGEIIRAGQPGAVLVRGPFAPGMRWEPYTGAVDHPRQMLPDVYPGATRRFRSTRNSDRVAFAIAPRVEDFATVADVVDAEVWGVFVDGCNRETVTIESCQNPVNGFVELVSIDMTDPDGLGTFNVELKSRQAFFQPDRYLFRNELAGSHLRVTTGVSTYRHYLIAGNSEGGPVGKKCRIDLAPDDQEYVEPTEYDAVIIFKHAYVLYSGTPLETGHDLAISFTAAAGTHTYPRPGATCGVFAIGEAVLFSPEWDARWQMEHLPDRTEEGREGYTSRTRQGPTIRRLTLGWTDAGTDLTRLRSGAFDWVEDSSNNPVSNIGDAGYNLSGILEDVDGGTRPMLVVRKAVEFGTPCYDPTCFLWGHLDSSVALENDLGDEGDNEQIRVQTLTFTEAK